MIEETTIGQVLAAPLQVVAELAEDKARAEALREHEKPLFEEFRIAERTYLVDTAKKSATEVKPPKEEQLKFPMVGSLRGIADLVRRHGNPKNGAVVVGTDGIRAYLAVSADEDEQRPELVCPYFHGDDAPQGEMGVEQLFLWLDRFHGEMGQSEVDAEQEAAVWTAVSSVKAVVADEYEVNTQGGAIEVNTKTKQGVTGKTHLPKYITVRQRLGVRDFKTERLYRLAVMVPSRERNMLSFRLTAMDTDGSHERFVAWAVEGLNELLNGTVRGVLDETTAQTLVDAGEMASVDEPVEAPSTTPWIVCEGP